MKYTINFCLPSTGILKKMGCGASVNKRAANSKNASHPAGQKLKAQETAIEGLLRVYDFVFFYFC